MCLGGGCLKQDFFLPKKKGHAGWRFSRGLLERYFLQALKLMLHAHQVMIGFCCAVEGSLWRFHEIP